MKTVFAIVVICFTALAAAQTAPVSAPTGACTGTTTTYCQWYNDQNCCSEADAQFALTYKQGVRASCNLNGLFSTFTACGSTEWCGDAAGALGCKKCGPGAGKPVCKEWCQKASGNCGLVVFEELLLLFADNCDNLPTTDCWNSAASVAISAVFVALVALIALLF